MMPVVGRLGNIAAAGLLGQKAVFVRLGLGEETAENLGEFLFVLLDQRLIAAGVVVAGRRGQVGPLLPGVVRLGGAVHQKRGHRPLPGQIAVMPHRDRRVGPLDDVAPLVRIPDTVPPAVIEVLYQRVLLRPHRVLFRHLEQDPLPKPGVPILLNIPPGGLIQIGRHRQIKPRFRGEGTDQVNSRVGLVPGKINRAGVPFHLRRPAHRGENRLAAQKTVPFCFEFPFREFHRQAGGLGLGSLFPAGGDSDVTGQLTRVVEGGGERFLLPDNAVGIGVADAQNRVIARIEPRRLQTGTVLPEPLSAVGADEESTFRP